MIILLSIALLSLSGVVVDSASNDTGCDAPLSNDSCTQGPGGCSQLPCSMLCGLTSQYDSCEQSCDASTCDVIECKTSQRCLQTCKGGDCGSLVCDARNCFQKCETGTCSSVKCSKNAVSCEQRSSVGAMVCEGSLCFQQCPGGECNMTCKASSQRCSQMCPGGNCKSLVCDAMNCTQSCESGGKCPSVHCSENVANCQQTLGSGAMVCEGASCTQECPGGECNMTCRGSKSCSQTCTVGECNMACSSSVKECNQTCSGGICSVECNADTCTLECSGGKCTVITPTTESPKPTSKSTSKPTSKSIPTSKSTTVKSRSIFLLMLAWFVVSSTVALIVLS